MKYLQSLTTAPGVFVLLLSGVLLSLASCGGGGGGSGGGGGNGNTATPLTASAITAGEAHTCAVVDGAAKCWGEQLQRQAG